MGLFYAFIICTFVISFFQITALSYFSISFLLYVERINVFYFIHYQDNIVYGISVVRNKVTFHTGKERSKAIIKYITSDVKKRVLIDKFRSLWTNPALCDFRANDYLVFLINKDKD